MEISKRETIPMQEKLKLSKSQGASTPAEKQCMLKLSKSQGTSTPVRCTRPDAVFAQNITSRFQQNPDAEYIVAFDASKEAVWIQKFIFGLGVVPTIKKPINMYCDNTGAISIEKDHRVTKSARHFRTEVHYLRETIEMGNVRIEKVNTNENPVDPFRKALTFPKHSELTKKIGIIPASSLLILIAIAAFYDYEIWQMDVKTVFLNGYLNEEVYMEQPEGFINQNYPNRVCKLNCSIYGLKQASRQWNKRFDDEIKKFGFSQNHDEPCVYMKASGSYVTFPILYVDDILIMGNNIPMLQDVKSYLGRCFAMKDLGEAAYILKIKIYRDRSKQLISLCQSPYIEKILKRYFMENSKCGTIPMQEKLKLSKSQDELHWTTVKNILKYLRNTKDMFLVYKGDTKRELRVSCYTDVGYLTDADNLKSQTRYVFVLNRGDVDWKSTKQSIFATSSTDAEYIAAFDSSKEAVWIRKFISELGVVPIIEEPINMYCDDTGAISIAKNHRVTKGARHFRTKVHYLRETIEMGDVKIEKVDTGDNLADPHSELTRKIGMIRASNLM
ncbi:retrotransposon protein, putative, ty1-copia subclass [Tanacetum coccineum]